MGLKLKNILKKLAVIFSVFTLNMLTVINTCNAVELNSANIKSGGDCGTLLKYNGIVVKAYYAYYEENGVRYPAYCLDKTKQGVNDSISYSVSVEDSIHDVGLWRYIVNGYPYKTCEELGCSNEKEAFTATKQAIYCYIHGNNVNGYEAIGEAGNRTLNALKKIVNDAQNSVETQVSNSINIIKIDDKFNQDTIDKSYISKTYEVKTDAKTNKYHVSILKEDEKLLEGIKIVDLNNNEKSEFESNEEFKILIPISELKQDGEFKINVQASVNTKPVFYGKAANSSNQDYALTAATYEDSSETIVENYFENKANIKIIKLDKETNERIEGVQFDILDENKNVVYANVKTDENGEIRLTHILPGTYYVRETKAKDGYIENSDLIQFRIKLNENVTITMNNLKEAKPKITIDEKEIKTDVVRTEKKATPAKSTVNVIKKLPVTGM
ncbi:MAG: SpaA isopeptide-forming pilin-related protein [Aeromonadales bacterium]|nr:SpaA isopeptide-forming pilin-related protein [Aeromonadales bacterium]